MMIQRRKWWSAMVAMIALVAEGGAAAARAQAVPPSAAVPRVQSRAEALAQDAGPYAARYSLALEEATARLRALQASAAFTDGLRQRFRDRLVGISIEHQPMLRIAVLLTGSLAVAETSIAVEGIVIPVLFRTGATASGDDVIRAMLQRGPGLNALLPNARGMGLDARTGELVILVRAADAGRPDLAAIRSQAEALTGVKVRFDRAEQASGDLSLAGGARITGIHPADGKRYACTSGFVVTDGTRTGLATAAHCPDEVDYQDPEGGTVKLTYAGQWGARTPDVQVNVGPASKPLFYADRRDRSLRTLGGARSRLSTRAGEWLCHYGESSGYSCAEVELIHFAPPGSLCAGACAPTWVSVRTNDCRSGDSGGPVFSGDVAFGITKGGSGGRASRCNFYFYMSTDFLPTGWRLLR